MTRKLASLLGVVMVALLLAACGGDDESEAERVAHTFFDHLADQDTTEVREQLCMDFRQNVDFAVEDAEEAKLDFALHYAEAEGHDEGEADSIDVLVHGKVKYEVKNEFVKRKIEIERAEEAPWTVQVFEVDGEWVVCRIDPELLPLLNLRAMLDDLQ